MKEHVLNDGDRAALQALVPLAGRLGWGTVDGEKLKLKLMLMRDGLLGGLGGGETQREGVEALGAWFANNAQPQS